VGVEPLARWRVDLDQQASGVPMNRTGLYAVIAVLAVAVIGFAVYTYQQQQAQPSLEIRVDETGVSVDGNG
jgi:uncharacterized protein HemX